MESDTAVVAFTTDCRMMSINPAACRLLGCTPPAGERLPLQRLFDARDLETANQVVRQVLESGRSSDRQEGRICGINGGSTACAYTVHPVFETPNRIIGVMLNFRSTETADIEHSQSSAPEPAHWVPSSDYQTFFEELPEGVFTVNLDQRITSFNHAAEQITGYRRKDALGRKCWEIFQADQCHNNCPLETALQTGQTYFDQEVVTLDHEGKNLTLVVNVNAVRDQSGRLIGAVETFRSREASEFRSSGQDSFAGIVGRSQPMQQIFAMLPDIAKSEACVLISGETGTGKDMVARAIHRLSPGRNQPFMAVNCSALAENLLESELFGHEKGAFTGATHSRPGRFETAGNGSLLLDEIGELKPALQVKLLRVLEQREFERVGSHRSIPLRARIISATNRNLPGLLAEGRFREDLYYRLKTVPIHVPPLRERPDDIAPLVEHFIDKFNARYGKKVRTVDPKVMRFFKRYHWPGNVRELERFIEHAFVFIKGPVIFERYLPEVETSANSPSTPNTLGPGRDTRDRRTVSWALAQCGGNRQEAAALLGISRTSMWRRMKALNLT